MHVGMVCVDVLHRAHVVNVYGRSQGFLSRDTPRPQIGTASAAMWTLRAEGRLFHSGLPHRGINSQEFVNEAVAYLQKKFYNDYPPVRGVGGRSLGMGRSLGRRVVLSTCQHNLTPVHTHHTRRVYCVWRIVSSECGVCVCMLNSAAKCNYFVLSYVPRHLTLVAVNISG